MSDTETSQSLQQVDPNETQVNKNISEIETSQPQQIEPPKKRTKKEPVVKVIFLTNFKLSGNFFI